MSEQDLALVRDAYEAWSREGPEAVLPFLTDEPEVHDPPDFPDAAVHRGREAVLARYRQWQEALGKMPVEIIELIPVGDEVVVVMKLGVEGPGSGVVLSNEVAHVVRVRDDKLDRQRTFMTREEAIAAAGESSTSG